jgi:RHS Repeat
MTSRTDAAGTTSYTYDGDGRLATLADAATGTTLTYAYNELSQVRQIQYGTGHDARTFGYDGLQFDPAPDHQFIRLLQALSPARTQEEREPP